jgi:ComEC/Rec2-related protein
LFIAVCFLSLGGARYQVSQRPLDADHVAHYNDRDQKVHLTGVVVRTPDVRDTYIGLHLEIDDLRPAGTTRTLPACGRILLRTPRTENWAYGDRLYAAGYLQTPPTFETFSYQEYLARQGIHSIMQNAYFAIIVYTILVGADAAVVSAALMAGLALLALRLARLTHGMASLAAAGMAMTVFDPRFLWEVGFQLSFMATLGLVLHVEPMRTWLIGRLSRALSEEQAERLAGPLSEFVLYTLAAQITTFPITAYHFQRLSLTSLIANPVILPAQPPIMILGDLATLAAAV